MQVTVRGVWGERRPVANLKPTPRPRSPGPSLLLAAWRPTPTVRVATGPELCAPALRRVCLFKKDVGATANCLPWPAGNFGPSGISPTGSGRPYSEGRPNPGWHGVRPPQRRSVLEVSGGDTNGLPGLVRTWDCESLGGRFLGSSGEQQRRDYRRMFLIRPFLHSLASVTATPGATTRCDPRLGTAIPARGTAFGRCIC